MCNLKVCKSGSFVFEVVAVAVVACGVADVFTMDNEEEDDKSEDDTHYHHKHSRFVDFCDQI